jgi:predicted transcriptional regulator
MATNVEQLLLHKGRNVHTVQPTTTVRQAVTLLGEKQIGAVLVCEADRVVGVVSERDCVREILWQMQCTPESPVRMLMRIDFSTVQLSDSIEHCMSLMNDRHTRHLPVVEHGRLVGLISMGDVIHGALHEQQHYIDSLETYIHGSPSARPPAH